MKKIWKVLLASTMTLGLAAGLIACNAGGTGDAGSGGTDSIRERYAFSAATAGSILSAMNGGSAQQFASAAGFTAGAANARALVTAKSAAFARATVTDEETIATLNDYMFLVEGLLGDGAFGMTTQDSDREEYAVKATVSYRDIEGNALSYILYYNETERFDRDDRDDWDDRDDRDDWDDRFEEEHTYDIDGILIVDGAEYPVYGRTETESDWDEDSTETQFVVQMSETRTMLVTQESENDGRESEQEYAYVIRENGRTVERSEFSFEQEDDETEIEFFLTRDGRTQTFYFEHEGRHGIRIYVGDRFSGTVYRVHVETDADGNSCYVYETGSGNYRFERPDFD